MTSLLTRSGPRSPRRHRYRSFLFFSFLSCTCVCGVFFHGYFEVQTQTDRQTRAHRFTSPFGTVVIVWNLCVRMQWVQIPCLAIFFSLGSLCPRAGIAVGLVGSAVGQLGLVGNAVGLVGSAVSLVGSAVGLVGSAVSLVGSAVGQLGLVGNAVGLVGSEWALWVVQ